MAAIVNNDTLALQLERVRTKLPQLFERDNVFFAKVARKGEKVSSRSMRVPLYLRPGGRGGLYDPNGGNMGRGTGSKYEVATVTPAHFKFGVEINKLVEMATNSGEKAIENAAKAEVKNSMAQFRAFLDKLCNRAATGILATLSSNASTVWTLTADTGFLPSAKFHVGQGLHVSDLTTTRTGTPVVTAIDDANTKITVDANPTGLAAGDTIAIEGSTASAGAITSVALQAIPYHQSDATSGTWQGLTRSASTLPEVITPSVNASSASLTTTHIRLAKNKIRLALGAQAVGNLVAYVHPAQMHAYEDLGIVISQINKGASSDEGLDLFFGEENMRLDGTKPLVSINADKTRIDFLNLESWGRCVMEEIDFFTIGDTKTFAPYTSGAPDAAELFYLTTSFQLVNDNPRKGSYIKSLSVPSGY